MTPATKATVALVVDAWCSVTEVAELRGVSPASTESTLRSAYRRGWVERRPRPSRRCRKDGVPRPGGYEYRCTEVGWRRLQQPALHARPVVDDVLDSLRKLSVGGPVPTRALVEDTGRSRENVRKALRRAGLKPVGSRPAPGGREYTWRIR